ncbi:hypothetical protein K435DRAFT_961541 [Dendrothele bispora CBS 962.96]|uniref:Uncharacterized protein n=1 Tax=Dendrothele bispora (strain CBS 962.96) TaxID=1314807 RepID=A0A4S8MQJ0_DENBC|nr:hypothetical protein K435DRAFT_961541 [Dendrothele bispora CBS 962.96]
MTTTVGAGTRPFDTRLDIPGLTQGNDYEFAPDMPVAARKPTQHEQDEADEKARRRAMNDLIQSWMDRLQLISLITTFLASVEAGMLQVTQSDDDNPSVLEQATNTALLSALVLHLHASFISFFAAFFLIRFKVKEANREELKVENSVSGEGNSTGPGVPPSSKGSMLINKAAKHVTGSPDTLSPRSDSDSRSSSSSSSSSETGARRKDKQKEEQTECFPEPRPPSPPVWSANPRLVQVGPFQRQPPIRLLSRCHSLCLLFATLGFVLSVAGIVLYAWTQQTAVKAVTTGFLGLGVLSASFIATARPKYQTDPGVIHE